MVSVSPSLGRPWTQKHLVLALGLAATMVAMLVLGWRLGLVDIVQALIVRLREAGPGVFFVAMALLPAVGFPMLAFTVAAGPVFGPTFGPGWVIVWSLAAVTANLLLTYWLANRALRPLVRQLLIYFGFRLPAKTTGGAWQLTLVVRLTPGPPFWVQSYVLGLLRVPLLPYLVVSSLVMAGFIVALVCGGDAIVEGNGRLAFVAIGVLVVCVVALQWWRNYAAQTSDMTVSANSTPTFSITFPGSKGETFATGLPVLAGEADENLFGAVRPAGHAGAFTLFESDDWLVGAATVPLEPGLEDATRRLYESLFQATRGRHLARIWNYVPGINAPGPDGLENYQAFCRGRSIAFEQRHGIAFKALLPAASAVGTKSAALTIAFAACTVAPRHVENPLQVPAYDYPGEYGPRAPCFARATRVPHAGGATVFISGTSAIRGHATVAAHQIGEQLECTVENLREISAACGLGPDLDRDGDATRFFRIYLRHPADQPAVADALAATILHPADRVTYLHADICRSSLMVEIDVCLFGVARAT